MNQLTFFDLLLSLAPVALYLRAGVFGLIWLILLFQKPATELGVWINRYFSTSALASLVTGIVIAYLLRNATGALVDTPVEIILLVLLFFTPIPSIGAGLMVAYHAQLGPTASPTPESQFEQ